MKFKQTISIEVDDDHITPDGKLILADGTISDKTPEQFLFSRNSPFVCYLAITDKAKKYVRMTKSKAKVSKPRQDDFDQRADDNANYNAMRNDDASRISRRF